MTKFNKVHIFAISSIALGIISFVLVFSNLTSSYSATMEIVEDFSYELRDVSDVIYSDLTTVESGPTIEDKMINFKITLNGKGSYFQFFFDILNASAREGVVKDIRIEGLENEDIVNISVIGIKKGDIIEGSRYIDNVKVVIECVDNNLDEAGNNLLIEENIKIVIDIE